MPNFEYALLALLAFGTVMQLGTLLFAKGPIFITAERRQRLAGIALAMDVVLIVCCLLYY